MKQFNTIKTQDAFLRLAHNWYEHNLGYEATKEWMIEIVQWLYDLGRLYQVLNMDFEQFRRELMEPKPYRRRYGGYWGSRSHYCAPEYYRVLKGFTYAGQPKKQIDKAWRIHKRFNRDKGKHKGWWYGRGWKKYLKHFNNRKLRAKERKLIACENYDELDKNWKVEDAWSWD